MVEYLIFSDESGRWNKGEYYIRSWVRMTLEQYDLLRKEVLFAKTEKNLKELKWKKFKNDYENFKHIFDVDFKAFITISKPKHFKAENYTIRHEIKEATIHTSDGKLTEKIKERIIYSVEHELFFNYYEKQHIENSVKALLPKKSPESYEYNVDNPQYGEWKEIAKECGIKDVKIIKKSEASPGIELADVVCGCIRDMIKTDKKAKKIYTECIKPKMSSMGSRSCPNPNLIFHNNFTKEEKKELNIFR